MGAFYQYTDYTATVFRKVDRTVFWKLGYWLARKYRRSFTSLMRDLVRSPGAGRARTWVLKGQNSRGSMENSRLGDSSPAQGAFHLAHTIREPVHPAR